MVEPHIAMIPLAASPERSLESPLGDTAERHVAVHLPHLCVDAVVLEHSDRGVTLLLDGSGATTVFDDVIAQRIDDPLRQSELLRQALAHEHEQLQITRRSLQAAETRHAVTLADIRGYAISRHHAGHLSRAHLNAFLRTFGLPLFVVQQEVAFTVTGTYLVDSADPNRVRDDAQDNLAVTLDRLNAVVTGSDTYTVTVDRVTAAE